jgi:hypothetical protein
MPCFAFPARDSEGIPLARRVENRSPVPWWGVSSGSTDQHRESRIPAEAISLERFLSLPLISRHAHAQKMFSHLAVINAGVLERFLQGSLH